MTREPWYSRRLNEVLSHKPYTDETFVNEPARSSGFEHLTDRDLAKWLVDHGDEYLTPPHILKRRGITIKSCSECDKDRMHYNHDYICIICRNLGEPQTWMGDD